jgi:predicted nucleotidyltransferase
MIEEIAQRRKELEALCRRLHVRRLDLFGSAARGDFDPGRSDLDFIVEFERSMPLHPFNAYFGLKEELEALLGRKVDLVIDGTIENPYRKTSIERNREVVYAA